MRLEPKTRSRVALTALLSCRVASIASPAQATIHFRKADVDANRVGRKVVKFALANYFQPIR